jgi:hypothetical protein
MPGLLVPTFHPGATGLAPAQRKTARITGEKPGRIAKRLANFFNRKKIV